MQGPALYVIVQSQAIFYVTGSRWNLHFAFSLGPFTQLYNNHSGQILQYRCNINKKATVLIYWSLIPRWPCGWKAWKKILFLALIIFIIILYILIFIFFFSSHHLPDKAVLSKKIVSYVLIVSVPTDSASATVSPTAENKTLISINSLKVYRPFGELNFNLIISNCHKICDILQSTKNTFFGKQAETKKLRHVHCSINR